MSEPDDNVVLLEPAAAQLRDEFIGWQCRLRQLAVREFAGRPTPGMRPRALTPAGDEIAPAVVVLIVKESPDHSTKQFRFQVSKTHDPVERYDKALELLAGAYFQQPREFSDRMTALFGPDSAVAARLLTFGRCVLEFEQYSQAYRLPSAVSELAETDDFFQATYWHNRLYNPDMPPGVRVLAFTPEWAHASARRSGA